MLYCYSFEQDYPSPGFLKKILIDEQVTPIFAINQAQQGVYEQYKVCHTPLSSGFSAREIVEVQEQEVAVVLIVAWCESEGKPKYQLAHSPHCSSYISCGTTWKNLLKINVTSDIYLW